MTKVEFVIIAFPKCGTTSLVENINKHSKINYLYFLETYFLKNIIL